MDKKLIKRAQGLMTQSKTSLPDWKKKAATLCKNEFPTISELVIGNNIEAMCERYGKLERRSIVGMDTFALKDLKQMYSNAAPEMLIQACLMYLNRSLNLKEENRLSDGQVKMLGRQLLIKFLNINIGELWFFFEQIISGYFGVFYGNIDPLLINNWAKLYMKERGQIIIRDDKLMIKIRDKAGQPYSFKKITK